MADASKVDPKNERRQKIGIRVVIVLILVAGSWYAYSRFRNQLTIVGNNKNNARVIPRESFGAKPAINVDLPVIGKFVYPTPGDLPPGYEDSSWVSGLLIPGQEDVYSVFADPNLWTPPTWMFDIAGSKQSVKATPGGAFSLSDYIRCPYVFGNRPLVAELKTTDAKADGLLVKFPSNGKPEPKLPSAEVIAGKWKAQLTSQPWISPNFPLRYKFTLKGDSSGETRFVELWGRPDTYAGFSIKSGESRDIVMERWSPDQPILVRISAVKEEPFKIFVKNAKEYNELRYEDGELLHPSWSGWDKRYAAIRIGDWVPSGDVFIGKGTANQDPWSLKPGTTINAIGYRLIDTGRADLTLQLPDISLYPPHSP